VRFNGVRNDLEHPNVTDVPRAFIGQTILPLRPVEPDPARDLSGWLTSRFIE